MADLVRMLLCLVAGAVVALFAAAHAGMIAMLIVLAAAGWAMAQHDHNYKKAQAQRS